jgi:hypothetical protein
MRLLQEMEHLAAGNRTTCLHRPAAFIVVKTSESIFIKKIFLKHMEIPE